MRKLWIWTLTLGALVAFALPAAAQDTAVDTPVVEEAATTLQSDPVYVHPEMESELSSSEADRLRQQIADVDAGPVYVAVLPEEAVGEAGGSPDELLQMIGEATARDGTYIVVAGTTLRAGSNYFAEGVVPALATEAVQEGDDVYSVVGALLDRMGEEAQEGDGGDGGSGFGLFPLLLLIGGGFFLFSSARRRRRQQEEERRQAEEVREVAMDDLVALGDDLRALDIDVEMPDADPQAKRDYVTALGCYEKASATIDRARRPEDFAEVTSTLEEGRYAMASAKARLEGRALPEHRAPCFFDPRHGPSVREVEWMLPDGMSRSVPACAADAARVERGEEPQTREILVGGNRTPYYNAPAYYGPWAGGYFGGFGGFGLFEGMLIGSLLSGGMGGFGFGGYGDGGDGGGDGFGGGDFGGGFGGGDFGGGDFGGGDFGGGDFG
jgi:hypothetical protein